MRYNVLGNSGLFVSEMCLGTMVFGPSTGRYAGAGDVRQDEVDRIVRRAFDAGINFVDTANVYSGGQSEEILGRSLKNLGIARHQVVIATKVEHATGSGPNDGGASRYHIMGQLKTSLRRLGTDHIDLYQLHGWDPATPLEETIRALDDLVRQGHVRYVGVSNWAAWQISKALGIAGRLDAVPFQSVQAYYSLAGRELEREIVPMLRAERLGLLVYSPLAGGYLSGKYRDGSKGRRSIIPFPPVDEAKSASVLTAMDGVAARHGASLPAIALAWLLHRRAVTSVILGVKRVDQLEENLKATEVRLSDDDLETLDAASALSVEYPAWMFQAADAARATLLKTGELPTQR
ncbi:aldo/keto reductase [Nannocystis punicea]|uniref:Aldo/keto reductase n=1 Tax=Nannocystis punicea TaxID=2995304 RepID=A0ABY7GXY6_9BACT|nr:aldo/keto reductase [Nannocystis poenicansa]WAS91803.1 aldo/keto reductase [Nannocystis poenicansa]